MRIRALILSTAVAVALVAPIAGAHNAQMACNGDITTHVLPDGTKIYNDHRSAVLASDENVPGDFFLVSDPGPHNNGGSWLYMESGAHAGLQTGGDNAILGPDDAGGGWGESCINTLQGHSGKWDLLLL